MKKTKLGVVCAFLGVASLILMFSYVHRTLSLDTSSESARHLDLAKRNLGLPGATRGQLEYALNHLQEIPLDADEYDEAARLIAKTETRLKTIEKMESTGPTQETKARYRVWSGICREYTDRELIRTLPACGVAFRAISIALSEGSFLPSKRMWRTFRLCKSLEDGGCITCTSDGKPIEYLKCSINWERFDRSKRP